MLLILHKVITAMAQRYLAVTSPGLEPALLAELRSFKIKKPTVIEGGVEFSATTKKFYNVLRSTRIAHRLYLRVDEFRARDQIEAYNKSKRFEWERLLSTGQAVEVRGVVKSSRIGGSGAITDAVADGIRDHFIQALHSKPPTLFRQTSADGDVISTKMLARCEDDRCMINMEAAGKPLHQRGWRKQAGPAPLRESVASAVLDLAGWKPGVALVDPMCGSGTFVIEAARRARRLPVRLWDDYAATTWANFAPEVFEQAGPGEPLAASDVDGLFGFDIDAGVLKKAKANAARAEVGDNVRFEQTDVRALTAPEGVEPGVVVCNPPYGERLSESGEIEALIQTISERFAGWRVGLLLPRDVSVDFSGLSLRSAAELRNGGIPVKVWVSTEG